MASFAPPPRRLNEDPQVMWGCTAPELKRLFVFGFAFWAPTCLGLVAVPGWWLAWFGLAPLCTTLSAAATARRVRAAKRGKPDQFFRQQATLWQQRWGLKRRVFLQRTGPWSIGRDRHELP